MIYKVEGIIIRSSDYGEGNKILTLYTKEMGKIGVMAKGAKKTKSRLSAVSQLFTYGHFVFYHGGGLGSLTQGDVIDSFRSIHQDIIKTAWAAYLVELLDKLSEEKEANAFLFFLLHTSLKMIEEDKDPEVVARIFELQLLQRIGIKPELNRCSSCRLEQRPFVAFSIREGGLICELCLAHDPHAIILSPAAIRLLRTFAQIDLKRLGKVDVKENTRKQLAIAMKAFMDTYVGVKIKSRNFLDQLSQIADELRPSRNTEREVSHGKRPETEIEDGR
jgi:DNA repair protein RecO (recombination protein O)